MKTMKIKELQGRCSEKKFWAKKVICGEIHTYLY